MMAYEVQGVEVNRPEQVVSARGRVALDSDALQHHFPNFPILPGVLLLDLLKITVQKWYDSDLHVRNVRRVRFSNYLKPGSEWQSLMRLESVSLDGDRWSGEIFSAGVKMASAILTLSVKG